MEVEFTARQVNVPKALRTQAAEGLERIARILGRTARASITFRAQRHLQIAELTIKARVQTIEAAGKADSLESALRIAIQHAEHQALRYRDRQFERKRMPKLEKELAAPPVAHPKRGSVSETPSENGKLTRAKVKTAIAVHSFPASTAVVEPHVLSSGEAVALKPMTIEEAVKDCEFRDRDLLIFRNRAGDLYVLHRRRDGQIELVEVP
ncbi:MAG TPA: HPF/RaiA family ribosome-associated protein [Terracidiphilus sp.]|jgi:putative sigma-54 modulation protein